MSAALHALAPDVRPLRFLPLWRLFGIGKRPRDLYAALAMGIAIEGGYTNCDYSGWLRAAWGEAEAEAAECAEALRRAIWSLARARAPGVRILAAANSAERRWRILSADLARRCEGALLEEPALVSIVRRLAWEISA